MQSEQLRPDYQPIESNQTPLESRIENEPSVSPQTSETYFTKEQALTIISQAQVLQELSSREASQSRMESILSSIPGQDNVSLSSIYKVADNKDYVNKIISMRFPSNEQKLQDIKSQDARPVGKIIIGCYKKELNEKLIEAFPQEEFSTKHSFNFGYFGRNLTFYRVNKKLKRSLILRREKLVEHKEKLAKMIFDNDGETMYCDLYDPSFPRATGERIKALEEFYGSRFVKKYHYPISPH